MAQAAPIIIGVIGLAMSAYSIYQTKEAADEAKDMAEQQARREEEQAEAIAEKEKANLAREMALNRARTSASGVSGREGETPSIYMQEYKEEREDDIAWIRRSGASAAEIARLTGKQARTVGYARAASIAGQSATNAYNWFSTYVPPSKPATPTTTYV